MSERIERILVPLDGSSLAESVLPTVEMLTRCLRAELILLHIIEEHAPQTVHGEPHLTSAAEAEAYLSRVAQRLEPGIQVEQHVHSNEENDVALSVASHAAELRADMVAMCTHGRSGLRRVVSGSIAQQVLRRVETPVLLVRPRMRMPGSLQNILVALDGTRSAEAALPVASYIAKRCGAALSLITVVPTLTTVSGDNAASARLIPLSTAITLDASEEQTAQYLGTLAQRLIAAGTQASSGVARGDTTQRLLEAAASTQADLVVLATHARTGLSALWVGSVAAGIIARVDRPVLMVRISGE